MGRSVIGTELRSETNLASAACSFGEDPDGSEWVDHDDPSLNRISTGASRNCLPVRSNTYGAVSMEATSE